MVTRLELNGSCSIVGDDYLLTINVGTHHMLNLYQPMNLMLEDLHVQFSPLMCLQVDHNVSTLCLHG
jgi:hypothetical protein